MISRNSVDNWSKAYSLQRFFRTAICQNDLTTVEGLIMHQGDGIDLNAWNADGICPIHQSCIDGNKQLMTILLRAGADIDAVDPKGWTSLHTSAAVGNYELTKYLIRKGADIMALTNSGELPIDLSLNVSIGLLLGATMKDHGYYEEASYYLSEITAYGQTQRLRVQTLTYPQKQCLENTNLTLYMASRKYSLQKSPITRQSSLPDYSVTEKKSVKHYSVTRQRSLPTYPLPEEDSLTIYPTSILKKTDSFESGDSRSPSSSSCDSSSSSVCSNDSECNEKYRNVVCKSRHSVQFDSETLFMNYLQENEYRKLSILLEDIDDLSIIDALDRKGLSAIHWSSIKGFPQCIAVLASFGADIDVKDPFGWTPLHAAVATNNISCVKKLLELNADLFAITSGGEAVFDWVQEGELLDILREHMRSNIYAGKDRCTSI